MSSEPFDAEQPTAPTHKRRPRYAGKNPRKFADKYKELNPELYPEMIGKITAAGKTPAGTHVPVLVEESMLALQLLPGQCGVDCTLGFGGHAREILRRILPGGKLLGLDIDPVEQPKTLARLRQAGFGSDEFEAIPSNYAGIAKVLKQQRIEAVDFLFADLGCSSMQIDDPARGFTFKATGPLDMRMNPNRGVSAASILEKISVERLAVALRENADEPHADRLASHLAGKLFCSTNDLVRAIDNAAHDESGDTTRRVFQALRIEVNEEFSALDAFLRSAPVCLKPGGRIVVISFHSGEDRRVKKAFQQLQREGVYSEISEAVITAGPEERRANPRAIPAKLRFAVKSK